ncbi:MAG: hypothetical protein J6Y80_00640 [Victivallales bacterium]|nr:hypothetical protein [Victivallales bacterium]
MYSKTGGHDRPERLMCDECFALFQTLQDKEVACSTPGCDGKWTWNRFQQLEAHARGKDGEPPKGFCDKCREAMKQKDEPQVPCRIKGCKNTWTWTRRMQQEAKSDKPPRRLCDECFHLMQGLEDRELPCRIKGCEHKVLWTKTQQLEWLKAGKSLEKPPARMCPECLKKFTELKPVEVPCRIKGCGNTWTYNAYEQLEVAKHTPEGQEPKPPQRMCKSCLEFFNQAKDQELPCSNRGCEGKWVWTRAMQLGAHIHGHDEPPYHLCPNCQERLKSLQPKELQCCETGCSGTWTYEPAEQLKDELLKRNPPRRHCARCQEFIKAHEPQTLVCEKCGQEFKWSVQEQLMTELGTFQKPRFCANCNTEELASLPPPEPVITPAVKPPFEVRIPTGGAWNSSPVTRDWPVGLTPEAIEKMAHAARRVVCLGDTLTACPENHAPDWVSELQSALDEKFTNGRTAVLNAGIPGCTTELALSRLPRDVEAFQPHLVVFSFAFDDAMAAAAQPAEALGKLAEDFHALVRALRASAEPPKLLCLLPNPIYPQKDGLNDAWRVNAAPDEGLQAIYDAVLRTQRACAKEDEVAVVDGKALFELVGAKAALAGMGSWNRPNAAGCENLARWLVDAIASNGLLK